MENQYQRFEHMKRAESYLGFDCFFCDNTGIANVANGEDDVEQVYCQCQYGSEREQVESEII